MAKSRYWSSASAPCRLEWKPSRVFATLLILLGFLGGVSAVASELPLLISLPLAGASLARGTWLARLELSQPPRSLVIPLNGTVATIDGEAMSSLQLQWRGPLAFLQWRDANGRRQRLQGWPDNLAADARRELRLAMAARSPAHTPRSMAP
jgi:toxin CptA